MPTVKQVVKRLLPKGTNPKPKSRLHANNRWNPYAAFPYWPPDAFAVASTLVSASGCYSRPEFAGGIAAGHLFDGAHLQNVSNIGARWSALPHPKTLPELQELWNQLYHVRNGDICDAAHACASAWWRAAVTLMILADEACWGTGFAAALDPNHSEMSNVSALVLEQHSQYQKIPLGQTAALRNLTLPFIPRSLCRMVPPDEVCVQPKTRTPQVGCTIRSLTHNLALLPSKGDVETSWLFGLDSQNADKPPGRPLNLLLVPFPYRIQRRCFSPGPRAYPDSAVKHPQSAGNRSYFLQLRQGWLLDATEQPITTAAFVDFLRTLLDQARQKLHQASPLNEGPEPDALRIHGLVLPELALNKELARQIAAELASDPDLEFFITGVAAEQEGSLAKNQVLTFLFHQDQLLTSWEQSKHHRWQVEGNQINGYQLNPPLAPNDVYWEHINVQNRHCAFWVFRPGASMATLICEDLARIDPVQSAIRAIGPNLLIALLMDGPQEEWRWPNRYATVLADDPGCSVLTFTSLGLIRRMAKYSEASEDARAYPFALWKEAGKRAVQLKIDRGCQALLLNLTSNMIENFSLDGRSDGGCTISIERQGDYQIGLPDSHPDWIDASGFAD